MTPSLIPDKPQHSRRLQSANLACLLAIASAACGRSESGPGRRDSALVDVPDEDSESTFKVSTAWLDFGTVDVGSSSTPQTITVTVSGFPVAFTPAIAGAGFVLTGSTCTNPQAVDACTLSVRFTPTTIGAASGVLTVGVASVALSGIGNGGGGQPVTIDRIDLGKLLVNQATPAVLTIAPNQPIAMLACASSSPDLTLASQTCPTTGTIDAPCTVTFTFKAATAGAKIDSIICTGGGRTIPTTVVATVVVAEPPVVSPPSGIFVANVGQTDSVVFTVSNAGSATAGPLTATISAGANVFSITSNDCTAPIEPLTTCRITVAYTPVSSDADKGILLVEDPSQPAASVSVPLSCMGSPTPRPTISPAMADVGKVEVGQSSQPSSFALQNTGNKTSAALTVTSNDPDFVIDVPSCPALVPNAACTFAVTFTPSATGLEQAIITVAAPDGALVATAKVAGEGIVNTTPVQLAMTPPSLDFGTLAIDEISKTEFFTVTNTGNITTGVLSVLKTDDPTSPGGASQFSVVTPCIDALAPGQSCPVSVTYRPTVRGASSALITVTDGTLSSTAHKVTASLAVPSPAALYCNGSWSSSISFGSALVGQTSEVVCTTFNNGTLDGGVLDGGALSITATTSGDFAVTSQGCASSQCTVTLVFKPTTQGVRTAKLTVLVTEGSGSSSSTAMLAGKGL
jgi:hypothetical protein